MDPRDAFQSRRKTFSFEFFPPRTPAAAQDLYDAITQLEALRPSFVSVTYGAGGGTRELTHDLVVRLKASAMDPMPHLTCVGHTRGEIDHVLDRYAKAGIGCIMTLRGDVPKDGPGALSPWKDFRYATELVSHIAGYNAGRGKATHTDPRGFGIGVAGYPEGHFETPNRLLELDNLKRKVDAGADFIVTQLFFDNRDFYDFRARCEMAGIRVPIVAGIMPITSAQGMDRMAQLALGARYPAPLLRAVARAGDNTDSVRRVGVHWATEQCRDLLDHGVAGLHFYTLNRSTATREVFASLGVQDADGLA